MMMIYKKNLLAHIVYCPPNGGVWGAEGGGCGILNFACYIDWAPASASSVYQKQYTVHVYQSYLKKISADIGIY